MRRATRFISARGAIRVNCAIVKFSPPLIKTVRPLPAAAIALDEANILKIQVNGKQALPTDIATPGPAMSATMAATK